MDEEKKDNGQQFVDRDKKHEDSDKRVHDKKQRRGLLVPIKNFVRWIKRLPLLSKK